jgi:hypothetical protein
MIAFHFICQIRSDQISLSIVFRPPHRIASLDNTRRRHGHGHLYVYLYLVRIFISTVVCVCVCLVFREGRLMLAPRSFIYLYRPCPYRCPCPSVSIQSSFFDLRNACMTHTHTHTHNKLHHITAHNISINVTTSQPTLINPLSSFLFHPTFFSILS